MKGIEAELTPLLSFMEKHHEEKMTYQKRIYSEKMRSDRVEMLYWLQQERRKQTLDMASLTNTNSRPISIKSVEYVKPLDS